MKAELLLRGGRIFDAFSGQFFLGDLAISSGKIVGFGAEEAERVEDIDGAFVIPGLIDAHVHLESSKLSPREFSRAVLPHGTTTVIADPHEIANVHGLEGIRWMIKATKDLPLRFFFMAPSCVPASPLETPGAILKAQEIKEILSWERVLGLGEVMNFPGVLARDPDLMEKLCLSQGKPIDGHAPGLLGEALWRYVASGPKTDHECTDLQEAQEKLRAGMHILIREGTTARNLKALIPILTPFSFPFVHFCTDDREPETLLSEGHMDDILRKAIKGGVPPEVAIASATIHTARLYGVLGLGALAPGYLADFLLVSNLEEMKVEEVYVAGVKVAEGGKIIVDLPPSPPPPPPSVRINVDSLSFKIPAGKGKARVIGIIPDQVVTEEIWVEPKIEGDEVVSDPERDILKIAVIERHKGTSRIGLGLVHGFGLKEGALASTVAHDSHNLIVVGISEEDMLAAVKELVRCSGGQTVVKNGRPIVTLPLPIGGLMSQEPLSEVYRLSLELRKAAWDLGSRLPDPFMTLSFLALPVIPKLKLTDLGLVDVQQFKIVSLFEGG
ncbi:adenine deaminase [Candidatus Bipolaricaulota bacterium]|nr:adenine deaminase [Candidatus Bipolaricaulota bacterium]